jgi:hypothetical protein
MLESQIRTDYLPNITLECYLHGDLSGLQNQVSTYQLATAVCQF